MFVVIIHVSCCCWCSLLGMSNSEVLTQLERGYRHPKPHKCPDNMYEIMKTCWKYNANERPTFDHLYHTMDDFTVATQSGYAETDPWRQSTTSHWPLCPSAAAATDLLRGRRPPTWTLARLDIVCHQRPPQLLLHLFVTLMMNSSAAPLSFSLTHTDLVYNRFKQSIGWRTQRTSANPPPLPAMLCS